MCFLYILPWLHKNAFKRVLQRSVIIGFDSSCVWHWFGTSAAVPGPLPGYPRRAMLFGSGFARSCRAAGFRRFPVTVCSWSTGGCRDGWEHQENVRQARNWIKTGSVWTGKIWKKSQKSETNSDLRFFMLVNFDENPVERTSAYCEFF